jgi:5-methylcytosine-specific restriction enzyme A
MSETYLLTWNPRRWEWDDIDEEISELRSSGWIEERWSIGVRRKLSVGSRIFLMRLGEPPKGIIASGFTSSEPFEDLHWDPLRADNGDSAYYVDINLEHLEKFPVISLDELAVLPFNKFNWTPETSGIQIPDDIAGYLNGLWVERTGNKANAFPEEINHSESYPEGTVRSIRVNAFERNPTARRKCIEYNGTKCAVCGMDFESKYGIYAKGYIQVHHIKPISKTKRQHKINPIKDLVPVCPNCHAAIHLQDPPLTVDKLRELINKPQ